MSARKCFLAVILFVFALTLDVFSEIRLQGVVTDNGPEPVVNALVEVINQADTAKVLKDRTDEMGRYEIPSSGVDDFITRRPGQFNLLQNYPNPFNPSTVIVYELSHPAYIRIEIYNVLGRKVKTLVDGFQNMGLSRVIWDATNDRGQGVPAGVYIYSLKAEGVRINRKMLLIDGMQGPAIGGILQLTEMSGQRQTVLKNVIPDRYLLRVSGTDIQTYEQPDLEFTGDSTLTRNVTVLRTVTDIDGNVYQTVKIGNQWWMAENLKVTHYRNREEISNVTDGKEWNNLTTGAYCNYDNNLDYVMTYGRLYNWYAVNDSRSIPPAGWHVPTDEDWKILEMRLGMSREDADSRSSENIDRGTNEGGMLKERGTTHWSDPNVYASNSSGFTALPGGYISNGSFGGIQVMGIFWSSTEQNDLSVWRRLLICAGSGISRDTAAKRNGYSVRCLRD